MNAHQRRVERRREARFQEGVAGLRAALELRMQALRETLGPPVPKDQIRYTEYGVELTLKPEDLLGP